MAIAGNLLISISFNIQKYVHKSIKKDTKYYKEYLWWVGLGLTVLYFNKILGEIGNFWAYGFASAVLVAPLGTVNIIGNSLIAITFLKEQILKNDVLGLIFCTFGTILIVLISTQSTEPVFDEEYLTRAILQPLFLAYFSVAVLVLLCLVKQSNQKGKENILVDLLISSICGGFSVCSIKAISGLTVHNMVSFRGILIFILTAFIMGGLSIFYLNKSLARFDTVKVVPINFVLFTSTSILSSSILYHDLTRIPPLFSSLGISSMFVGFIFLIRRIFHSIKA